MRTTGIYNDQRAAQLCQAQPTDLQKALYIQALLDENVDTKCGHFQGNKRIIMMNQNKENQRYESYLFMCFV